MASPRPQRNDLTRLDDQQRIHINDLEPGPVDQLYLKSHIEAHVALVWPYSSATQQFSILLVEPDVLLSETKAQVKVTLHLGAAKELASTRLGVGDAIKLGLHGAVFEEGYGGLGTPGKQAGFELHYHGDVRAEVVTAGGVHNAVDYKMTFFAAETMGNGVVEKASTPIPRAKGWREEEGKAWDEYGSTPPQFLVRPRAFDDPFTDAFEPDRRLAKRKRLRYSGRWRLQGEEKQILPAKDFDATTLEYLPGTTAETRNTVQEDVTLPAIDSPQVELVPPSTPLQAPMTVEDITAEPEPEPEPEPTTALAPESAMRPNDAEGHSPGTLAEVTGQDELQPDDIDESNASLPEPEHAIVVVEEDAETENKSGEQPRELAEPPAMPDVMQEITLETSILPHDHAPDTIIPSPSLERARVVPRPTSVLEEVLQQIGNDPIQINPDPITVPSTGPPLMNDMSEFFNFSPTIEQFTQPVVQQFPPQFQDFTPAATQLSATEPPKVSENLSPQQGLEQSTPPDSQLPSEGIVVDEDVRTIATADAVPLSFHIEDIEMTSPMIVEAHPGKEVETLDLVQSSSQAEAKSEVLQKAPSSPGIVSGNVLEEENIEVVRSTEVGRKDEDPGVIEEDGEMQDDDKVGDDHTVENEETSGDLIELRKNSPGQASLSQERELLGATASVEKSPAMSRHEDLSSQSELEKSKRVDDNANTETLEVSPRPAILEETLPIMAKEFFTRTPEPVSAEGFVPGQPVQEVQAARSPSPKTGAQSKTLGRSPGSESVIIEQSSTAVNAPISPTQILHELKSQSSQIYHAPLLNLLDHFNSSVDILAIASTASGLPEKAKSGPRDHFTTLHLVDPSLSSDTSIPVQIFRPYKKALPRVSRGDVVLLHGFKVVTQQRKAMLLSAESSSWAIFSANSEDGDTIGVEALSTGPPIEYGEVEQKKAHLLRRWWVRAGGQDSFPSVPPPIPARQASPPSEVNQASQAARSTPGKQSVIENSHNDFQLRDSATIDSQLLQSIEDSIVEQMQASSPPQDTLPEKRVTRSMSRQPSDLSSANKQPKPVRQKKGIPLPKISEHDPSTPTTQSRRFKYHDTSLHHELRDGTEYVDEEEGHLDPASPGDERSFLLATVDKVETPEGDDAKPIKTRVFSGKLRQSEVYPKTQPAQAIREKTPSSPGSPPRAERGHRRTVSGASVTSETKGSKNAGKAKRGDPSTPLGVSTRAMTRHELRDGKVYEDPDR